MIAFRSASSARLNFSTSITLNKPAGVIAGDVLLAFVMTGNSANTVATPSGWTRINASAGSWELTTLMKVAGPAEPASYTFHSEGGSSDFGAAILAYSGVDTAAPVDTAAGLNASTDSTTGTAPSVDTTGNGSRVVTAWGFGQNSGTITAIADPTTTSRVSTAVEGNISAGITVADFLQAGGPGATGAKVASLSSGDAFWATQTVALRMGNQPPNAPTLTSLADGGVIDVNATQRASHAFSDPDPGDSQSAFDHFVWSLDANGNRTALVVDGYEITPNQWVDYAAGLFVSGVRYERKAGTYDSQGAPGPLSESGFFVGGTRPPAPTITAPLNGATVNQNQTVEWSAPNQDAYQVQVLDAGVVVDGGDTGEVTSTTARSHPLTFPDNNVTRTIRVRIKDDGLWSDWYEVTVTVSFTQPAAPVVTLTPDPDAGSLLVGITNPTPTAEQPATSYNEVWVDDGDGEERRATNLPTNTTWTYWTPVGSRDYSGNLRVVAVADNGVTASTPL